MKLETGQSASIITYKGITPSIHPSVFLCEGARIIGDVEIGADSSVWYNTVIRGDVHYIRIGARTNIQDLSMLHVTHQKHPLNIGNGVTVGHSAVLHGATIHDFALIGMGAKVLDRCIVNKYSLIAAGTVLREGFEVPEGTLVAGVPGKVMRELTEDERKKLEQSAQNYVNYVAEYRGQLPIIEKAEKKEEEIPVPPEGYSGTPAQ
jgi:carbonic anhydrase/acetyltransferase-like protein (isoleucine patch superfamily)